MRAGCFRCLLTGVEVIVSLVTFAPLGHAQLAVEPYAGAYWFDEDALDFAFQDAEFDAGPILGARVLFPIGERWSVGGGYGYAALTLTFRVPTIEDPTGATGRDLEAAEHLYYGTVEYAPIPPDPVGLHFSGELGGAAYAPDDGGSTSDLLAGFGMGADFRIGEPTTIRLALRDHLRFCSRAILDPPRIEETGLCEDDMVLHNIELSAGLRVRF